MVAPEVVSFVAQHLRTVDDLVVLFTAIDSGPRWWDAAAMARELGIPAATARQSLDHLARGNLLDIRITGDVRYQFNPGTDEVKAAALACAAAYRSDPVGVLRLVAGSGRRSISEFADAFRIRRDDSG